MTASLAGILNLTPDSFSDGGHFCKPEAALAQASRMIAEGARVVDVGAESTRPGAAALTAAQEWARLSPVLEDLAALCHAQGARLSVDTRHAENAVHALKIGADWINDVGGFSSPDMVDAVRASSCHLVMMHSLTVPADPAAVLPESVDAVEEVARWCIVRAQELAAAGIAPERLIFDPGIGFGKTARQSLALVEGAADLRARTRLPLLFGHSRKSFLLPLLDEPDSTAARDATTVRISAALAAAGVEWLRVHNVALHASRHPRACPDDLMRFSRQARE